MTPETGACRGRLRGSNLNVHSGAMCLESSPPLTYLPHMAPERKRSSREDPPRVYLDRGVYKGDLRRWGRGRVTLRDPEDPHGEPPQNPEVALRWALAYVDQFRDETESRQLKRGPKPCSRGEAAAAFFEKRSVSRPTTTAEGNRSALNALRRFAATDRESGRKGDQLATNRITPDFLQRFFDKLAADGYAAGTLSVYRQVLSAFLRDVGYGDKNAALRVDLAQVVHEEVATWTEDALAAIRDAADALDRERTDFLNHRLAVELALASGARPGSRSSSTITTQCSCTRKGRNHARHSCCRPGGSITGSLPVSSCRHRTAGLCTRRNWCSSQRAS